MSKELAISDSWKQVAKAIAEAWQDGLEAVLKTGQMLLIAKDGVGPQHRGKLPHGEFQLMVEQHLPFSPTTARKLMAICKHPILSKRSIWNVLPSDWTTLYALSLVDNTTFDAAMADGRINPRTTNRDVLELRGLLPQVREKDTRPMSVASKPTINALQVKLADANKRCRFANDEAKRLSKEVRNAEIERDYFRAKDETIQSDPIAAFNALWNAGSEQVRDQIRGIVNQQPALTVIVGGKQ